ncbi:MAG: peptide-methionine (R)-S-oxide reductase MsrB [Gammaproteobacteria bacterium]
MNRRGFLAGVAVASLAPLGWNINAGDDGRPSGRIKKIDKTEEEWRALLTEEEFHVLREEGTERPGSSPLNDEKRAGIYVCAGCALPLFKSKWKYESGTGWPSFFTAIKSHVETKRDYLLFWPRTEYHCARCGGHQGHIFEDGPQPTGQRWCNNGVALNFEPA